MATNTNARYSALEHGGLEAAEVPDVPEVAPGSSPPLARRSSLNQPETLHPGQYEVNVDEHGNYYSGEEQKNGTSPAPYPDDSRPAYISQGEKNNSNNVEGQQVNDSGKARRYCGMRLPILIGLIVGLAIVVIAAVLGGVLGTVLTRHHHSDSNPAPTGDTNGSSPDTNNTPPTGPLQAGSNTGLATTKFADGSGRMLTYYQDPEGRIIENSYLKASGWTLEDHNNINSSVVTTAATPGSPLAAVSYVFQGDTYRHIFFLDGAGNLKETNSSTYNGTIATEWSTPSIVSTDASSSSLTVGLAACADHNNLNGIRVYYGSSSGYIEEYSWLFNDTSEGWQYSNGFDGSDANSGVSCVNYDGSDGQYLNVYLRNATTGQVQQWYYSFGSDDGDWSDGPTSWENKTAVAGSDITVCNDDQNSEYVMFQVEGGMIVRGLVEPYGSSYEGFIDLQPGAEATKLAASYVNNGALLVFQNSSSPSTMWATDISRFGATIMNIAIP